MLLANVLQGFLVSDPFQRPLDSVGLALADCGNLPYNVTPVGNNELDVLELTLLLVNLESHVFRQLCQSNLFHRAQFLLQVVAAVRLRIWAVYVRSSVSG